MHRFISNSICFYFISISLVNVNFKIKIWKIRIIAIDYQKEKKKRGLLLSSGYSVFSEGGILGPADPLPPPKHFCSLYPGPHSLPVLFHRE